MWSQTPGLRWAPWRLSLLALALCLGSTHLADGARVSPGGYTEGDEVFIECRNFSTGAWEPGPICHETNSRFSVFVGVDSFRYCALEVSTEIIFDSLKKLINQTTSWQCRIPLSKHSAGGAAIKTSSGSLAKAATARPSHVPLSISFIGLVEGESLRMNTRLNFLFHLYQGEIVGATAYPVLDRLQYVKLGSLVSMHGSVVWLRHHNLRSSALSAQGGHHYESQMATASALAATMMTLFACTVLFLFVLKPAIIRRCMKKD